jgi:ankyrin repeat protein
MASSTPPATAKGTGQHFVSDSLHAAAYGGDAGRVAWWVADGGAAPAGVDGDGRTALHWAALGGHAPVVEYLLALPAVAAAGCVNAADPEGWTPLASATAAGHVTVVRALLGAGASPGARTSGGQAPLHYHKGRVEVIDALLPAVVAAGGPGAVDARDKAGQTALHRAAGPGHVAAARALLAAGASVNARDAFGRTPLSYAAEELRPEMVSLLLGAGADADAKDRDGRTPAAHCAGDARLRAVLLAASRG